MFKIDPRMIVKHKVQRFLSKMFNNYNVDINSLMLKKNICEIQQPIVKIIKNILGIYIF